MRPLFSWFWVVTITLIALDRITKILILNSDSLPREIIPGFFSIVHVTNTGIAFGFFSAISPSIMNPLLTGIGVLVILVIVYFIIFQNEPPATRFAMHLLAAGAVGNIWDRIQYGKVIDFLDFSISGRHWPSFNIADASISCGLVLILTVSLFSGKNRVSKTD